MSLRSREWEDHEAAFMYQSCRWIPVYDFDESGLIRFRRYRKDPDDYKEFYSHHNHQLIEAPPKKK